MAQTRSDVLNDLNREIEQCNAGGKRVKVALRSCVRKRNQSREAQPPRSATSYQSLTRKNRSRLKSTAARISTRIDWVVVSRVIIPLREAKFIIIVYVERTEVVPTVEPCGEGEVICIEGSVWECSDTGRFLSACFVGEHCFRRMSKGVRHR